ncbi:hypothetical protein C0581_02915 [Candidatus Parcubacteria bacterium]|nr:MAG: hypothetical protein C0581_02915 [Candidatus Parcubacteria bacterium]
MVKEYLFKIKDIILNVLFKKDLIYVIEGKNWSIKWDGYYITKHLPKDISSRCSRSHVFVRNSIIHFGSISTLVRDQEIKRVHGSNKVVLTWFHISAGDTRLGLIPELNKIVDIVHTSCSVTRDSLVKHGFDSNKVIVIPLGIDLDLFRCYSLEEKKKRKEHIGLPKDKIIIGSFQKDGQGWEEGFVPKLEKGPDIFCKVLTGVAKKERVHVLLTGPSRGYVKKCLDQQGVGYTHVYLENYFDIVDYYNVLDVYVVTSRAEGGPKSLLESWACGVPVVSTQVGMVNDCVTDNENGLVSSIEDVRGLVEDTLKVIQSTSRNTEMVKKGLESVKLFRIEAVSQRYVEEIYKKII